MGTRHGWHPGNGYGRAGRRVADYLVGYGRMAAGIELPPLPAGGFAQLIRAVIADVLPPAVQEVAA